MCSYISNKDIKRWSDSPLAPEKEQSPRLARNWLKCLAHLLIKKGEVMGKIKALVTEMGYDSAKRYLEEIKRKLERDKERSKHAVSNDKKDN